jgi:hypothetical protein
MLNSKSGCGIYIVSPFEEQPRKKQNKSYYYKLMKQYDIPKETVYYAAIPVVFGWYILSIGVAFLTTNGLIR